MKSSTSPEDEATGDCDVRPVNTVQRVEISCSKWVWALRLLISAHIANVCEQT